MRIVSPTADVEPSAVLGADPGWWDPDGIGGWVKHPRENWGYSIRHNVYIGEHCMVVNGTERATTIGAGTKLLHRAHIGHDVIVGENCIIGVGSILGGFCEIGNRTQLKMGVIIRTHVKIGTDCVIGMGAVVVADVPDGSMVYGNPARVVEEEK